MGENKNKKQKIRLETSQIFAVLEFSSLRDVEKYVTTIFYQGAIRSDLYKETNGTYSLVIEKARSPISGLSEKVIASRFLGSGTSCIESIPCCTS